MCRVECVGDLDAQIEHRFDLQRLASDHLAQGFPLQQFHCDEGSCIELVNFVDGTFGWFSADAALASRSKRLSACESLASSSGRNFNATWRPSFRSSASYTIPIPPPPILRRMRQWEIVWPTGWDGVAIGGNVTSCLGEGST